MTWLVSGKQKHAALVAAALFSLFLIVGCSCSQTSTRGDENSASASSVSSSAMTTTDNPSNGNDVIEVEAVDYAADFINGEGGAMFMYKAKDGTVVYDLDIDKKAITDGQSAVFTEYGDAGLAYILKNGYPNKTYTNNKGMDAYITQMAIWWYVNEDALSSDFKNATSDKDEYGLVEKTHKLVDGAKNVASDSESSAVKIYATDDPEVTRVIGLFE